jgi:transcriptional regulator with XRE-family HTH domain
LARDLRRALGLEIQRLRLDAGLSQRRLAIVSGVDQSHLSRIERGDVEPSVSTLVAIADALGGDVRLRIYPGTGPRLRDPLQATMLDALLKILHPRWRPALEVPVHRPARGVIDVVLDDSESPTIIAGEAESDLRRIEAQTRWANEKSEALPSSDVWRFAAVDRRPRISRLLLLRSTDRTRALANRHRALLRAIYAARPADAYAALTHPSTPWPDASILWVRVDADAVTVLPNPPRGVEVGR